MNWRRYAGMMLRDFIAGLTERLTTRLIDFHWRHSLNHRLEVEWLKILLGDDTHYGEPLRCVCNVARYENGHMECCPLRDYPTDVLVIDDMTDEWFEAWKRREFEFVCADVDGYTWAEFEWDLEHCSMYSEDADDAPYPGRDVVVVMIGGGGGGHRARVSPPC